MPHVANVIVNGGKDYREVALHSFEERLSLLRALVAHLSARDPVPSALLLPAGFFCASSAEHAERSGEDVAAALAPSKPPFAIIWGVDGWTPLSKTELDRGGSGYPFFVFVLPKGCSSPLRFQQLAVSSWEAEGANDQWNGRPPICCDNFGLLICGESWGDPLLARIEAANPDVLLIPAHRKVNLMTDEEQGWARMSWHIRLDRFSKRTGIPVILSEHTRSSWRHDYAWGAKSVQATDLPNDLSNLFTLKLVEV